MRSGRFNQFLYRQEEPAGHVRYTAADLEFAAFMASRKPWKVQKERHRPDPIELAIAEYDRGTEDNLRFIHGQDAVTNAKEAA